MADHMKLILARVTGEDQGADSVSPRNNEWLERETNLSQRGSHEGL